MKHRAYNGSVWKNAKRSDRSEGSASPCYRIDPETGEATIISNAAPVAMAVTKEEINARRTPAGAWTRRQLASWGVPWPPPRGWKQALIAGEPVTRDALEKKYPSDRDRIAKLEQEIERLKDIIQHLQGDDWET